MRALRCAEAIEFALSAGVIITIWLANMTQALVITEVEAFHGEPDLIQKWAR